MYSLYAELYEGQKINTLVINSDAYTVYHVAKIEVSARTLALQNSDELEQALNTTSYVILGDSKHYPNARIVATRHTP